MIAPADLYSLAYRQVRNREDAEDVAQEAAVKLWLRGDEDPAHARRVVRTTAIDYWRAERVHSGRLVALPSSTAASAEREALARLALAEACHSGPAVVALAAGFRVEDIAARTHEHPQAVKSRVFRWRQARGAAA